ncbi:pyrroloquinoline quinone biosynthesis protein B [Actinoplanes tereljensis]|uniref:Coenzyme PQQ synthesis protein B n=1 Tax=Paractinoplanes tereljensis TaxID=571912 RepID=A0A919NS98_9ACTN|nr:MBL fold metallo-hydrolase [Actinoplanes tereljensis]GIF23325.1 coenzyme PQQ synthesis protein B [Actinoplanes tereljensis]
MRVRVLGSAAGGGSPQWNCACPPCRDARRTGRNRTQDTVAVSGDGTAWFLLNAGPDIRSQILATPELAPGPGLRDTPLRGVLLTTAELDHTIGLLSLREAVRLTVHATPAVSAALQTAFPLRSMLAQYTDLDWREMPERLELDGGLIVDRLTVGAKRPRYATGTPGEGWVSALRLSDRRTGSSFVYATCLPVWTDAFDAFVDGAAEVLLDGTFATDDELTVMTGRPGSAAGMGHLPIVDSRPHAARHPGTRFRYGHLNNTNAMAGDDVVSDGTDIF